MKRIAALLLTVSSLAACRKSDIPLASVPTSGADVEVKTSSPQQLPESSGTTVKATSFTQDPHPNEARLGMVVRLYSSTAEVAAIEGKSAEFLAQQTICEGVEREAFETTTRVLLRRETDRTSLWIRYALRRARPNGYTLDFLRVVRLTHADQSEVTLWEAADGKPLSIVEGSKAVVGDGGEYKVLFAYGTNNQDLCARKDENLATLRNAAPSLTHAKLTVKAIDDLVVEGRNRVDNPYQYESSIKFIHQKGKLLVPPTTEVLADAPQCVVTFKANMEDASKGAVLSRGESTELVRTELKEQNADSLPVSAKRVQQVKSVEFENRKFDARESSPILGGLLGVQCTGEDVIVNDVQAAFDAVFGFGKAVVTAE